MLRLIGTSTGILYRGLPQLPAGIDTTQPFGFHPQNPWPNSLILDPTEINIAQTAVTGYNAVIQNVANTFGFVLADMNALFNTIRQADFTGGYKVDGMTFKTTYVTGGLFSLDGVHPTSQGHAIIANEFIKAINTNFNANIPKINIATIPSSIQLVGKVSYINGYPQIDPKAFDHLLY